MYKYVLWIFNNLKKKKQIENFFKFFGLNEYEIETSLIFLEIILNFNLYIYIYISEIEIIIIYI